MKHSRSCHPIDSANVTFHAADWATRKAKKGFLIWLAKRVTRFGTYLVRSFTLDPEPYISEHYNRKGERYFRVYDPKQDVHHTFDSEEAVCIWLEERHHP